MGGFNPHTVSRKTNRIMITKTQASVLFGYSYQLINGEGKIHDIAGVTDVIMLRNNIWVEFSQVGTDYKILARPLSDLTKEIKPGVVPIVELEKFTDDKIEIEGDCLMLESGYNWYNDVLGAPDAIIKYLYENHFALDFPEGTWVDINNKK